MIEIIGEIGVNHNGDLQTALELANAAKQCGCDVVKTQLFNVERVYPRDDWPRMKPLELDRDDIVALKNHCDGIGIEFMATPDEIGDANFLKEIGCKRIKTSSQDITDIPFLIAVAKLGLPMIVSTGACTRNELDRALAAIVGYGSMQKTFLHCVSAYPAPLDEMNLSCINYLRHTCYFRVGLSDHSPPTAMASLIALGLGATVFERHLTLDRDQPGPDHAASLEPMQMHQYVDHLRRGAVAMGDGNKRIMASELDNRKKYKEFIDRRPKC
jgi:N-acetylneuraminate synthase/N,N'-diacetyllegionaminate synthase